MKTKTKTIKKTDPVLEVEKWKDETDRQVKNMSLEELKRYYLEAISLVAHSQPAS